jgi:anti-sigma regulatory factor (Ser/Thr protein kinase)
MSHPATAARPDPAPAPLPARTGRQHPGPATPTHTLMLNPDDQAPGYARAATRTSLTLWGLAHLASDAQAVTSELVANAAAASRRAAPPGKDPAPILLWLTTQDGHLIIRVWDPDPTAPPRDPPEPGPGQESGRGLMLVDALTAWRDCTPAPNGGKHVRAALPLRDQPPASYPLTRPEKGTPMHADVLPSFARTDLERLKLAADVILRLGGDDVIPAPLEAELGIFRDRLEHALLLPARGAAPAAPPA